MINTKISTGRFFGIRSINNQNYQPTSLNLMINKLEINFFFVLLALREDGKGKLFIAALM